MHEAGPGAETRLSVVGSHAVSMGSSVGLARDGAAACAASSRRQPFDARRDNSGLAGVAAEPLTVAESQMRWCMPAMRGRRMNACCAAYSPEQGRSIRSGSTLSDENRSLRIGGVRRASRRWSPDRRPPAHWTTSSRRASCSAAPTPASPASASLTRRATGPASTSSSAAPSRPPIFNDPTKVKFVPLSAKDRFTALQSGEVDVLVRNTTWTHLARHLARPELHWRQLL